MVPWTDEGNFTFFGTKYGLFSYPIFTINVFLDSWVMWRLYLSRGGLVFFYGWWTNSQFKEIRVLSFESIWVPQKKGFSKKSPTLYNTNWFLVRFGNPGALSPVLLPQELKSLVGTPQYWAPEMLLGRGRRLRWRERFCWERKRQDDNMFK